MRKHLVFITVMLLCLGLCFASGLLKGAELLITSTVFIILWALRSLFAAYKNLFTNLLLASFATLFTVSLSDIIYHSYLNKKPNGERIESEVETIYKFKPNTVIKDEARYGDLAEMGRLTKEFPQTRAITCQIDELGYRNPMGQKNKKNRIILIGDSFGFGAMTDGENIADYLRNDFGLETYNLSLPGYGPWQEHYTLRQEIDKITKADTCTVVWLLFTGNDLAGRFDSVNVADHKANWRDDFYAYRKKSPIREGLLNVFNPKALADTNVKQGMAYGDTILYYQPYEKQEWQDTTIAKSHPNYLKFLREIDKVKALCKIKNVHLCTVLINAKERALFNGKVLPHYHKTALNTLLGDYLSAQNMGRIIFPPTGKDDIYTYYLKTDTHLDAFGNAILGRYIADYILYNHLGRVFIPYMPISKFIIPK